MIVQYSNHRISLDIHDIAAQASFVVKRYDNKNRICAVLTESGKPYTIDSDCTAVFMARKPDDTVVYVNAAISGNTVFHILDSNTTAAVGRMECELRLFDADGGVITSPRFCVVVEEAVVTDEDIINSTSEGSALAKLVDETAKSSKLAASSAKQADESAEKAENAAKQALEITEEAKEAYVKLAEDANAATDSANQAAEDAAAAAMEANAATEGASWVNISAVQTAEGADITVTDRDGAVTTVHLNNLVVVNGWADIQETVRLGIADTVFPVGYEFVTPDATTGANVIWAVRGHDHHQAVDNSLIHTMTLEAKHVYSDADGMGRNFVFGAAQALYYAETELAAGTYHFGWQYAYGAIKSGSYQFTLTQPVPAGGQIVLGTFSSSIEITNCLIATFGSVGAMDPIESDIMVTSGSEGVNLGTVYNNYSTNKNLNCAQRILWGSSNYAQSAVRQWLNSDQAAGAVWVPTTRFDRPPTWADTYAGFMSGLPAEFLAVVQTAAIPCRTNAVFEVDDLYGTEFAPNEVYTLHDKFFLLSRPEVYGTWYSTNYKDGEPLEFYEGFTDTECIKYDAAGLVRVAWLRSPFPSHAHNERLVNAKGTLAHDGAFHELAVAPACIIA